MQLTVAKALKELKTLDDKIERAHDNGVYIGITRGNKDVFRRHESEQDIKTAIQSSFDKIAQLRENRAKIKSAVVQSNANSMVELPIIGNVSVAQAIEYKSVIAERKRFIDTVKRQYAQVQQYANRFEQENKNLVEQRINAVSGGDKAPDESIVKGIQDNVESKLGFKVIDPKNILEFVQKELDSIAEFEDNVDDIINTSNVMTVIEI